MYLNAYLLYINTSILRAYLLCINTRMLITNNKFNDSLLRACNSQKVYKYFYYNYKYKIKFFSIYIMCKPVA